jgi:hypothetical protein
LVSRSPRPVENQAEVLADAGPPPRRRHEGSPSDGNSCERGVCFLCAA